jgi:hypothetical protein
MNKNHWEISNPNVLNFASWKAQFNTTKMLNRVEKWKYFRGILLAAEKNQISRVLETEKLGRGFEKYYYNRTEDKESYVEFADRLFKYEEASPDILFYHARNAPTNPRIQTKLCYYNLQSEIEEEFCDILSLAEKLMPGAYSSLEDFASAVGILYGNCIKWSNEDELEAKNKEFPDTDFIENGKRYSAFDLSISLHTNIWFSWVRGPHEWGLINDEWVIIKEGEWYDNRELANRHTPRFNEFIQQVKKLTLEMGGIWEIDLTDTKLYFLQEKGKFDENGIILDL